MVPPAYVVHSLPGRTRLRIPSRKGDANYFDHARVLLRESGIAASCGMLTASVVLEHRMPLEEVRTIALEHELFAVVDDDPATSPLSSFAPLHVVATGFVVAAVYQAFRKQFMGSGVENLWNAYGAIRTLHNHPVAAALVTLGLVQLARGNTLPSAVNLLYYALNARDMAQGKPADAS